VSFEDFKPVFFSKGNVSYVLRLIHKSDRSSIAQFAVKNGENLRGPFPVTYESLTGKRSSIASFVSQKLENAREGKGMFCVIQEMQQMEIVGFVSAFQFEWRTPKCEMSWMLDKRFEGLGIARYSCTQVIRYLQNQARLLKIICRISPENATSIQLAERLGFANEGMHKRDFRDGNDNLLDVLYFGLLL
jgi:RimJ/RimL family protein N-acetyltransferase